ncbi:Low specificity L-threonine aldolase [Peptococcaceae bacterium CEB3]|nr:Low specificity L-threonine aldolase [Peptococcaceae bacterium CEB3]
MQYFESDYMEGAHPLILQRLLETNMEKTPGYGTDKYSRSAREKIRRACGCPEAEVYFMVGGTQTNATVINSLLHAYEGVLAADTGHINVHEAGTIEAGGHKVLTLGQTSGKISAQTVAKYIGLFNSDVNNEHMVRPGLVYISHPTEYGTLYTKAELEQLRAVCQEYKMPLFLDGARLGYGLTAEGTDVTLEVIADNCDVFYIGGTKVGALFGEAVVITKPNLIPHFFTMIKQHGALLAKGRLLGIQFDTLFTDDLYKRISKHAIHMAEKLKKGLVEKGYRLYFESPTNQQFVVLENEEMERLSKKVSFGFWESLDSNHTVVRFATSWATQENDIEELLKNLHPAVTMGQEITIMKSEEAISIGSEEQLEQFMAQGETAVLYFSSEGCNVCQAVFPKLTNLIHPRLIRTAKINIDEHPEIAGQLLVFTVPTVLIMYEGKEILRESRFIDFQRVKRTLNFLEEADRAHSSNRP